jgi:hypothetical protein
MKWSWSVVIIGFCVLGSPVWGGDSGTKTNASATNLIARLHELEAEPEPADRERGYQIQEEKKAILLQLGAISDQAAVPVLKEYAYRQPSKPVSFVEGCAHVALAKLGDQTAFDEIVAELRDADRAIHSQAFTKLGMVGNTHAIKILASYLSDTSIPKVDESSLPPGTVPADDIEFRRRCDMAAAALAQTIKPSPTETKPEFYTDEDIQKWREWWEANKSKYQ